MVKMKNKVFWAFIALLFFATQTFGQFPDDDITSAPRALWFLLKEYWWLEKPVLAILGCLVAIFAVIKTTNNINKEHATSDNLPEAKKEQEKTMLDAFIDEDLPSIRT
jgi:hypothetical protein